MTTENNDYHWKSQVWAGRDKGGERSRRARNDTRELLDKLVTFETTSTNCNVWIRCSVFHWVYPHSVSGQWQCRWYIGCVLWTNVSSVSPSLCFSLSLSFWDDDEWSRRKNLFRAEMGNISIAPTNNQKLALPLSILYSLSLSLSIALTHIHIHTHTMSWDSRHSSNNSVPVSYRGNRREMPYRDDLTAGVKTNQAPVCSYWIPWLLLSLCCFALRPSRA